MKTYYTDFINKEKSENFGKEKLKLINKQKVILNYLFDNCDSIYLTNSPKRNIKLGFPKLVTISNQGSDDDSKFINILNVLKNDFIKSELSSDRYLINQNKGAIYKRYYYKLSETFKKILLSEDLIFDQFIWEKHFYTLEDPVFLKGEKVIANVITHENSIILYIDENDNKKIAQQGIDLTIIKDDVI